MYSLPMAKELGISQHLLERALNLFGEKYPKDEVIFALEERNLRFFFDKVESREMSEVVDDLSETFSSM